MKKLALLTLLCALFFTSRATITPVALTGYNADIISNGTTSPLSSISSFMLNGFDSAGYELVSQDYNYSGYTPSYYLPTGGLVTSALTGGLTFQLANYSSNNALRFHNTGDNGTLSFVVPQNAGALYICGLSGSGISNFDVVVNFSDATTQTFSSLSFPDWYASGGSVSGIGRVSTSDGHTEGTSSAPSLFEIALNIDPLNYSKTITGITVTKTSSTGFLAILAASAEDICSGAPVAGAVTASSLASCSEFTSNLSLPGSTASAGIVYQWQSSADNITWTSISGATSATYSADVTDTIYYRAYITCTVSGLSDTSSSVELLTTTPSAVIAALPFNESFESWIGACYTYDRPGVNWLNNPVSGNNSWRRDDQGSDASWTSPGGGLYSPVSTAGAHSARFHSYYAGAGTVGNLDLHIDLSAPGTKQIAFDYENSTSDAFGTDQLFVQLSVDGGVTFTTLGTYDEVDAWTHEILTTDSAVTDAIVRFSAVSDFGYSDIGIDNLSVVLLSPCSGTPTAGTISASLTSGCSPYNSTLIVDAPVVALGIGYQWQTSTDGATWADISGETNTIYTATGVSANTYFRAYVTCSYSGGSDTTAPLELLYVVPTAIYASLPFFEGFESWIGTCFATDRPGLNWLVNPSSGNDSWRRDDQGADASWTGIGGGTYSPISTEGSHSARFHSYLAPSGSTGSMDLYIDLSAPGTKQITFDYHNSGGPDNLQVQLSEDGGATFTTILTVGAPGDLWAPQMVTTTSTSATAVLRFLGTSDDGSSDIGVDSLSIFVLPHCSGTPVAGTLAATVLTGCSPYSSTISFSTPTVLDGISYQWQSSTDGVTYTNIPGETNLTYTASVSTNTYYRAYVNCSYSSSSDTTTPIELFYVVPTATYATIPFFESFESWIGSCYSFDRPGNNWLTNPSGGNDAWRRDDQAADASWTGPGGGAYSPVSTDASHSARFHSYLAPSGSTGTMDLYIDLSPVGTKQISFDYHNNAGTDNLQVQLSEDGGTTFTTLYTVGAPGSFWAPQSFTTTSVAANAIIRFLATSDDGGSDIGIDSLSISVLPGCTGTPVAGAILATDTFGCSPYAATLSFVTPVVASGISYQWQSSPDGAVWTNISGATNVTYSTTISAHTYVRAYVLCSFSGASDTTSVQELVYVPPVATYATLPFFESFENWIGSCYSFDRPGTNWLTSPATGNNSWRRDDQGSDASWTSTGFGSYSPASTDVLHSARFHSYYAGSGTVGNMDLYINLIAAGTKEIRFDYHNTNGSDVLNVQLSEDGGATFTSLATLAAPGNLWVSELVTTTSTAANAIIRFAATSDYGSTDIGIDSLYIAVPPAPCAAPTGLSVAGITTTSATASWTGVIGASGYEYVVDGSSADPAGAGTATTLTSVTIGSLTSGTTYYVHVRTNCGAGSESAWVTTSFTTLSPCLAPTGLTVSGVTATTATATWGVVTGSAGYQYVINGTSVDPVAPGIATTAITAAFSSLTPATTYYVHVRTECTDGDSSVWVTTSFTTLPLGCSAPTGLGITGITTTGATAAWTAAAGAAGYQYVVDGTAADPTTAGTPTALTTVTLSSLASGTVYFFHVRTECTTGDSSTWVTIPFTTLSTVVPCEAPTGLSITGVTTSTATASWTPVSGAAGYQYVVDNTPADPIVAGITTTLTTVTLSGLAAASLYYVHVRTECTTGDSSVWVTDSFTTLPAVIPCIAASGLMAASVTDSSAVLSWNTTMGVSGYEYVINTTLSAPTAGGTFTTDTSYTDTSLTCATTYYLHVRTDCSADSAAWVTISFTTDTCHTEGVAIVNKSNFDLQAYPNPATEQVTVVVTGVISADAAIHLTDVSGRVIDVVHFSGNKARINVANLSSGIYFLNYTDGVNRKTLKMNKQ